MIIRSKSGSATLHRVELPEIGRDWFIPAVQVIESPTIATSTASAAVFKQVIRYGISSVKRSYSIIISETKAIALAAMLAATTSNALLVTTASGEYEAAVTADIQPLGPLKNRATITVSVLSQVR